MIEVGDYPPPEIARLDCYLWSCVDLLLCRTDAERATIRNELTTVWDLQPFPPPAQSSGAIVIDLRRETRVPGNGVLTEEVMAQAVADYLRVNAATLHLPADFTWRARFMNCSPPTPPAAKQVGVVTVSQTAGALAVDGAELTLDLLTYAGDTFITRVAGTVYPELPTIAPVDAEAAMRGIHERAGGLDAVWTDERVALHWIHGGWHAVHVLKGTSSSDVRFF